MTPPAQYDSHSHTGKIVYTTFNYVVLRKSDYTQYGTVAITYKHISVNCFER